MTQTPQTPAGWYPSNGMERWWDGNQWSDHTRPIQPTQPQPTQAQPMMQAGQPAYGAPQPGQPGQPAYYQMPPAQKSHTARNILIIFGVLFLVFVGGCFAVVAIVSNEVNNVVDESLNDDTPGGPNVPLEIEPGEGFEVAGFVYSDGWTLGTDPNGYLDVENLKVSNERDKTDQAVVEIKVLVDNEVLATTSCTSSDRIPAGITVTLDCFSGDPMPEEYDKVTINDAF